MDHASFFVSPNWHVALVHFPLALVTLGVLIELFAFFWRSSSVRQAARWMILLGALAMIPTLTSGVYAFANAAKGSAPARAHDWADVLQQSQWGNWQWHAMRWHIILMCAATGIFLLVSLIYLGASDRVRQSTHYPLLLLLVIGVGAMLAGAWFSGEGVFRYEVAVAPPAQTAVPAGDELGRDRVRHYGALAYRNGADGKSPADSPLWNKTLRRYLPPLQLHTLLAGLTIALAIWGIGTMFRRWSLQAKPATIDMPAPLIGDYRAGPPMPAANRPDIIAPAAGPRRPYMTAPTAPPVRTTIIVVAGLFVLAYFLALLTAASGLWFTEHGDWHIESMRNIFTKVIHRNTLAVDQKRMAVHAVGGVAILLFALLLAVFTRFARRARVLPILILLLLLAAVAIQVWVGVLLLYDLKVTWL
jgi:uncharacterized membrane protein